MHGLRLPRATIFVLSAWRRRLATVVTARKLNAVSSRYRHLRSNDESAGFASVRSGAVLGRMSLEKKFLGIWSPSEGRDADRAHGHQGSAGYVAIERVTGMLHGRQGSFVFQHTGTMDRGAQQLSITVVPDSGTDQLVGIAGKFNLTITDGKHFYEFDYSLPR